MFDRVNDLAMRACKAAQKSRHHHLASLIYSYVPVTNESEFRMLHGQVKVLRTLLKLRPSYSPGLVDAVNGLIAEVTVIADNIRSWR